ncbi:hypothetical protein M1D89_07550 [Arthrobacter sp. D3-18]
MSGIDDLNSASNDRWAKARRRAQGLADHGVGDALKVYYTRYFPAGFILLTAVGTVVARWAFGDSVRSWVQYVLFGSLLACLGAFIGAFVYNAKRISPRIESGTLGVLISLESSEQKYIRRQISGRVPLNDEHLVVARGAAVQLRKNLAFQVLLLPVNTLILLPQCINFSLGEDTVLALIFAIAVIIGAVGAAFTIREFVQTGRFLESTAAKMQDNTDSD